MLPVHRKHTLSLLALILIPWLLPACTTPAPAPQRDDNTLVGRPPSPDDDPFFRFALPAEVIPAEHSGIIGETEDERPVAAGPTSLPESVSVEPPRVDPEVLGPDVRGPEATPEQAACFSCVRICSLGASVQDCASEPENLICGWGTHPERFEASKVAQAQCDATLDMARQMPIYSRIEGTCPPASCR